MGEKENIGMWDKRKPEEPNARPTGVATNASEAARSVAHTAAPPAIATLPEAPRNVAVFGPGMTIKGEVHSQEDLYVDGEVDGSIELREHCLTVGPNGKTHSSVRAREVVVLGSIQGNVEARDKIAIRKNGKLVGDIKTAGIIIDDGAYFKGSIDIVKTDSKPAPQKKEQAMAAGAGPKI
jgi:cytoskeletal protein CcmA (bactofilin family)